MADATYEVRVERCLWLHRRLRCTVTLLTFFLGTSDNRAVFIGRLGADEVSRIDLHYGVGYDRLATRHDLVNLFVAKNEEAIGVLLARRGRNRGLRLTLGYGVQLVTSECSGCGQYFSSVILCLLYHIPLNYY